jgi:hypothetical protein
MVPWRSLGLTARTRSASATARDSSFSTSFVKRSCYTPRPAARPFEIRVGTSTL